jgi:hypothetical protein
MASVLELPLEVMPNDHSDAWWSIWDRFLEQFGIEMTYGNPNGPIWSESPWIASVKSKNYKDTTHAIVMHEGGKVLFDPSTAKTYRTGQSLLGKDIVKGGYIFRISDFSKLHKLNEYRSKLAS